MNELLFHARIEECGAFERRLLMASTEEDGFATLLEEYQGSPVSSLAKELGHVVVEDSGIERFDALHSREASISAPMRFAYWMIAEFVRSRPTDWSKRDWRAESSQTIAQLKQGFDAQAFDRFTHVFQMLVRARCHRCISELGAVVQSARAELSPTTQSDSALSISQMQSLLTYSISHDIILSTRNSLLCIASEQREKDDRRTWTILPKDTESTKPSGSQRAGEVQINNPMPPSLFHSKGEIQYTLAMDKGVIPLTLRGRQK